jgi:predicted nucleic acid-binding protein
MTYLFDVNALIALGFREHLFHERMTTWINSSPATVATCSITELGFVRVLGHTPSYAMSMTEARALLLRLKKNKVFPFIFFSDGNDVSHLPSWVKSSKQTTDGHLMALATSHGARLATFDRTFRGAYLIP